jgi:penicillin-binding protein 1A
MRPGIHRASDTTARWFRQCITLARRHPVRAAMLLPLPPLLLLLPLYAVLLAPFTPSLSDLRKARIESPSVLLSLDGMALD